MKQLIILSGLLLSASIGLAQSLQANAGEDEVYCQQKFNNEEIILGASNVASGGQPPYTYRWYIPPGDPNGGASYYLSDTTAANPTLKKHRPEITALNNDPDYQTFYLEVTDSVGSTAEDDIAIAVCIQVDWIGCPTITATVGDTVTFTAAYGLTCGYQFVEWPDDPNIVSDRFSTSVDVVISDTNFIRPAPTFTNEWGCTSYSLVCPDISFIWPLGKEEITDESVFTLYPNPSSGRVSISATAAVDQVEVYDLQGRLILSEYQVKEFMLQQSGLYLVKLMKGDQASIQRLVITD